jgi:hypothetical protein
VGEVVTDVGDPVPVAELGISETESVTTTFEYITCVGVGSWLLFNGNLKIPRWNSSPEVNEETLLAVPILIKGLESKLHHNCTVLKKISNKYIINTMIAYFDE